MHAVSQRIAGELLLQDGKNALILHERKPGPDARNLIYLRYALVTRGPLGDPIFPAVVLDDWGREIGGLKLYRWIRENGERFPRAEIFGFEADGRETQAFLRGIELYARLPCYAYQDPSLPVGKGHLLSAILLPDSSLSEITPIKRPADFGRPLASARVTWWQIPANAQQIDLSALEMKADPGY